MTAAAPAAAEELAVTVLNDGEVVAFGPPDAAADANGNIHIVATGTDALTPSPSSSDSGRDIYYMMVQPDGTVLIDATNLTASPQRWSRPQVVVTSTGHAVVTFNGSSSGAIRVMDINPTLDNQDGDAAVVATVAPGGIDVIGVDAGVGHHASAIGSDDTVHILKQTDNGLLYLSFTSGATPTIVTTELSVAETGRRGITPGVAMDSNDNVHVLYQADHDDGFNFDPIAYTMLDGSDGSVLIGRTLMLSPNGVAQHGSHLSAAVDANDKVHLIYGDKRNTFDGNSFCFDCNSGGDMFYSRLNPARHPQNGAFGSVAALREGSEVQVGPFWYAQAFRADNGAIHVFSTTGGDDSNSYHMLYAKVTPTSGGASVTRPVAATTGVHSTHWSKHYVTSAADQVIWSSGQYSIPLAMPVFPLVMSSVETIAASKAVGAAPAGGGKGGSPGLPLLLAFALAGLLRAGRRAS